MCLKSTSAENGAPGSPNLVGISREIIGFRNQGGATGHPQGAQVRTFIHNTGIESASFMLLQKQSRRILPIPNRYNSWLFLFFVWSIAQQSVLLRDEK